MTGSFRTEAGGRLKRSETIDFSFDGKHMKGYAGDTLASALIANGVHLVARSFKYHRPRGILTAGSEEPNALIEVKRDAARVTPNLRATQVELYQGLQASSQNRWPSLSFDVGGINNLLSPIFASGFYYKTFMWPRSFWKTVYEPNIRAAAGLGKPPTLPDPDRYQQRYAHCDVLVIGAGPAGLTAAIAAKEAGARVIIVDEGNEFGGSLLTDLDARIDSKSGWDWTSSIIMTLAMSDKVTCLTRTTAFGYFADNMVGLCERITDHMAAPGSHLPRERLWQVRAKQVVIASGALERPMVFPENDRPGIMLADAARTYLNRYGAKVGNKVVVATATDSAYLAAIDLKRAGVVVPVIVDYRPEGGMLTAKARAEGIRVELGATICETFGKLRVTAVKIGKLDASGEVKGTTETIGCDTVLMSGGWTPTVSLFSQSRGKLAFDAATETFVPGRAAEAQISAGGSRGTFNLAKALDEGYAAGEQAARLSGLKTYGAKSFEATTTFSANGHLLGAMAHNRDAARVKAFVDFQHDVTAKDIKLAVREGFQSIEHVKRYTTTGMATDQGKTSNLNALSIAAKALDRPIPAVGVTTFRMPYTPTTFGIMAGVNRGELYDPVRKTPTHTWAEAQGAVFEDVGLWKRVFYFPKPGDHGMHDAVVREVKAVRECVGLFDASTLGKIEVVGPDAGEFMHRIYTNPFLKLEVGRCRYGIMTRDDGFVFDDGVVGRLAPDRFHVTTTTGGAPRVLAHMEDYLQTEWPDLKVWLTSGTEQWATFAVQGPKARDVIAPLVAGIDLSADSMPHMSVREGTICGVPTRLFRMSFTGEFGFEINVPSDYGLAVWEALYAEVTKHGGLPYGTEAMHVLRAEKGYIIVGQETDGTVTPDDVGLAWAVGKSKPDFVGKRGLMRADLVAPGRKQLVGLASSVKLVEGAQLTPVANPARRSHAIGHVTSAYDSPTTGKPIALALLENGRARTGETLYVPMPDGPITVTVVDPVFYDTEGKRLNG
jgi:sarcosine oxidase subunit alpha